MTPPSRRGFLGALALGGAATLVHPTPAVAEPARLVNRMKTGGQWAKFLRNQDLLWERIPRDWTEGPFLGNGLLGSTIYVPKGGNAVRFDLQHSEVQDHRPEMSGTLYGLARLPIGHFTLTPTGTITGVDWRLDLWNAELSGTITTSAGQIAITALVHNDRSVLMVRVAPSEGERAATWDFHPDKAISPRMRTNPIPDYVPNPDPEVRPGVVVQPLLAGGQHVTAYEELVRDEDRWLYATVAHSHPGRTAESAAVAAIAGARRRPPSRLVKSHREWWNAYYPKSFVSLPDQRLQSFYWIQLYKLAAATRADAPVMATSGPWLQPTGWPAVWWNLNVQLEYWPIYGSNHLELDAVTRTLDENRQNLIDSVPAEYRHDSAGITRATDRFCRVGQIRRPGERDPEIGNLTWALHNVWLTYRHTMDDDLLRDVLFPLLRRAINFYLHFLAPGPDGRLHLPPTFSPEYGGSAPDCNYDLALIRWGCRTLLEAADRLDIDDPLKARWRQVLTGLTDYPVDQNGFMIGAGVPFAKSHRHYSHMLSVYPLYLVTWEQPERRELIEKSLNHWIGFTGALQGYSFTGAASIAAQMGRGDQALRYLKDLMRQGFIKANTMYLEGGGPVIETPLSAAQSMHDMLVQSWGGLIRVFPALPASWADVTVHDFRTEGAFLVSAVRRGGATRWIRVRSLAGEPCRVRHGITGKITVRGATWRDLGTGVVELDLAADAEAFILAEGVTRPVIEPVEISVPGAAWGLPPIQPPGETTPVDLSAHFDNDGVSTHENMADGDFDGTGRTYPAEELPPAGPYLHQGVSFLIPSFADGAHNNLTARGQVIAVPPGRYARLRLVGACAYGSLDTKLIATYADGSTAELPFVMSDWAGQPAAGGSEVTRCTHRHGKAGPDALKVALFEVPIALDPARELRSITMPVRVKPQLHVFALSVEKSR
ncbi:glycosyl hydrolase family 95 catalytic domain-containing protein [Nonomuraea lactucae]|uniref:glycosyl hydrolase family 95 catalytic domain-containing protein n=1 Tax=Nonomuraea lactucae TaxID=2249762 RepID=UPI000DE266A4|nr:twin-arginine translocation signal domain-containing protein [Nonomuraea lactucae]